MESNYPTNAVILEIDNNEIMLASVKSRAFEVLYDGRNPERKPRYILGDWLQEKFTGILEATEDGLVNSLANFAMGMVDWPFIAEHYINKTKTELGVTTGL